MIVAFCDNEPARIANVNGLSKVEAVNNTYRLLWGVERNEDDLTMDRKSFV